jgi:enoyl-CoA hydratase/carnithine racemase
MPELSIIDRGSVRLVSIDGEARMNVLSRALVKERRGWTDDDIRRWLVELHTALRELERCPKPWIAAVNGLALGGGCELLLACDLRVVDPAAQIGLTETRIGIVPGGGGTVRLPRLIGLGRARDMILTARRVPADEALRIGLVDRVSPPGGSVDAALALGNEIAANAPLSVSTAKAAIADSWDLPLDQALERERMHYETVLRSEDRLEGLKAFAEKRTAKWTGK